MLKIGGQVVPRHMLFLVCIDSLLLVLAVVVAVYIRFMDRDTAAEYILTRAGAMRILAVVAICQASMYYHDLYDLQFIRRRRTTVLVLLLQALGVALTLLAGFYYFESGLVVGRGVLLLAAPCMLLLVCGWRLLLNTTGFSFGGPERVLMMGTGDQGIKLVREVLDRPEFNIKVVGFLDEKGENLGKSLINPSVIGAAWEVEEVAQRERADRIIISLKERRGTTPVRELLHLRFRGVAVEDAHSLYERITGRILLDRISPSALILSQGFRKSGFLRTAKRMLDVSLSAFLLVLSSPIIGMVALAIRLEDGRPILFRQQRVGLSGQPFEILKFRSMRQCPSAAPSWTSDDDDRITRVGAFIRKYRLDELPQLWNVLRGEMSLVGPRPEQPYFCELLDAQIPFFGLRHSVRPGITGWAQIKHPYAASVEDTQQKLEFDLFYIKHLSISLDLAILVETVKVVLLGRGAK